MAEVHVLPSALLEDRVRIHVAGCGGNGSQMLSGLARLHHALIRVGHPGGLEVTAFDPDRVSEANVGRQLFYSEDVGRHKCSVLVQRLNACYRTDWRAVPELWAADGDRTPGILGPGTSNVNFPHILITCVDTAKARREIHDQLTKRFPQILYWLDLGNRQQDGQVIFGQPPWKEYQRDKPTQPRLPVVTEIFPELLDPNLQEDNRPSCSLAEALESQDLFINDFVSRGGLQLLWDGFRKGKLRFHGYFINLVDGELRGLPVPSACLQIADKPKSRRVA